MMRSFLGKLIILFSAVLACLNSYAQTNTRHKFLVLKSDTLQVDSLSIVPGSFKFLSEKIDSTNYVLKSAEGQLIFKNHKTYGDSVEIEYKVFPFNFSQKFYHKNEKMFQPSALNGFQTFLYKPATQPGDAFKLDGLNRNGSLTRGISFGNNQDLVVNSNLNLQLSGKISDRISILAAIADDNIPIQPEGNTQQLQEFDKVFIQLYDDKTKLIAGDFVATRPASYFLNYYKRAQGASVSTLNYRNLKKRQEVRSEASVAVSKGKFSRNIIIGVEGNQGPYRLTGAENEAFIIVLSGSERVFIDGQLLQRGQENDYIIDYNTAQITFTARRIITKDKRIIAEFQYSDKNYARSLVTAGIDASDHNWAYSVHYYNESDNRNKPLFQNLTDSDKEVMRLIGDSTQYAFVNKADTVAFSPGQVLYALRDTIVNGILYKDIWVYSTSPDSARYRPQFTEFGAGKGNYVLVNSTANGRVFKWVAPVNGLKQGNYEPMILLATPKQKQMLSSAFTYKDKKGTRSNLEIALSRNDPNTFSKSGNENNDGYGVFYSLDKETFIGDTLKKLKLITGVKYETVNRNFNWIERYRAVEFERDWNRTTAVIQDQQQMITVSAGIKSKDQSQFIYNLSNFSEKEFYSGLMHGMNTFYRKNGWKAQFNGSLLKSSSLTSRTSFLRHKSEISKTLFKSKLVTGLREEQEQSVFRDFNTDTLLSGAFNYFEWQAFMMNGDSASNTYEVKYVERTDWLPSDNMFKLASIGRSAVVALSLINDNKQSLKTTSTYRILEVKDSTLIPGNQQERTLVNRIEYSFRAFRNSVTSNTFYELGSGLEVKKEFTYLEVAAGQGNYAWKDYNENGIQELNEFEISVFPDQARFIRVYTPTSQFVKTYNTQFNEVLGIYAPTSWKKSKSKFIKFIAELSNQTAYRLERKLSGGNWEESVNPLSVLTFDSSLVSLNSNIRSTLYFKRNDPVFGIDYTYQEPRSRQLLTNGFESRSNRSHTLRTRLNISRAWLITFETDRGTKYNKSAFLNLRDYSIDYSNYNPVLTWQRGTSFKLSGSFKFTDKKNHFNDSNQVAIIRNYSVEARYNEASKGSLNGKVSYISISYSSNANSAVGFEMLEALLPGNNFVWNVSYQRNLSNNMQLNFTYDGRKSPGTKAIHTGGVSVRAFF